MIACPICGEVASNLRFYRKHVGEHQRRLSLLMIPSVLAQTRPRDDRVLLEGPSQLYEASNAESSHSGPSRAHSSSPKMRPPREDHTVNSALTHPPFAYNESLYDRGLGFRRHATIEDTQSSQDIPSRNVVNKSTSAGVRYQMARSELRSESYKERLRSSFEHHDPVAGAVVKLVEPSSTSNRVKSGETEKSKALSEKPADKDVLVIRSRDERSSLKSERARFKNTTSLSLKPTRAAQRSRPTLAEGCEHVFEVIEQNQIECAYVKFNFAGKDDKHIACHWEIPSVGALEDADDVLSSNPSFLADAVIYKPIVHRSLLDIDTLRSFQIPFSHDFVSATE
jgi:hypothetical protein